MTIKIVTLMIAFTVLAPSQLCAAKKGGKSSAVMGGKSTHANSGGKPWYKRVFSRKKVSNVTQQAQVSVAGGSKVNITINASQNANGGNARITASNVASMIPSIAARSGAVVNITINASQNAIRPAVATTPRNYVQASSIKPSANQYTPAPAFRPSIGGPYAAAPHRVIQGNGNARYVQATQYQGLVLKPASQPTGSSRVQPNPSYERVPQPAGGGQYFLPPPPEGRQSAGSQAGTGAYRGLPTAAANALAANPPYEMVGARLGGGSSHGGQMALGAQRGGVPGYGYYPTVGQ